MRARKRPNLLDDSTYPSLETLLDAGNDDRLRDFHLDLSLVGPEEAAGGHLCNTAPTTLQSQPGESLPATQDAGGYDTLEILIHGEWLPDRFECLTRVMDRAKQEATNATYGSEGRLLEIAGEEILVWASGVKRGLYCSWCFTWQGMDFAVTNRRKSEENSFGIHLTIGSLACMELGGEACWSEAKRLLVKLGFELAGNKISRADMCVDLPGVSTHDMATTYSEFKYIARARKSEEYKEGYRRTGFRRGSGTRILIRVYDKLRELGDSKTDLFKEEVLIQKRWGGSRPKDATRVEFQLRREALKDFAIDSVEELFRKADQVSTWLTHAWFRMTTAVPERNHTDRVETSDLWKKVQNRFAVAFGASDPEEVARPKRRVLTVDPRPLKRQITGCLTSVAAIAGRLVGSVSELADYARAVVFEGGTPLVHEIREKRARIETCLAGLQTSRPWVESQTPIRQEYAFENPAEACVVDECQKLREFFGGLRRGAAVV